MSPGVVKLVREAAEDRGNRLHGAEFDATTWSARTCRQCRRGFERTRTTCGSAFVTPAVMGYPNGRGGCGTLRISGRWSRRWRSKPHWWAELRDQPVRFSLSWFVVGLASSSDEGQI